MVEASARDARLLATEQRMPGLGNGVLQDILYRARTNPRSKVETLTAQQRKGLFDSVKRTLREMADKGGRGATSRS